MTAEVAILNKGAVALAADSKVSIGFRYPEKTYDSQNKIFTLSKVHPVGIMVYNNADFMNYPWETIIKQYRSEKAGKVEPTMELWARDFISFLRKFGDIKKEQIKDNIYDILCACFDSIVDLAIDYAQHNNVSVPSNKFEKFSLFLLKKE